MGDIVNHDTNDKGEPEVWITIKDASDLLACSERNTWSIINGLDYEGKKVRSPMPTKMDTYSPSHKRKKMFVRRSDVENYLKDKAERDERERLEALKVALPSSERYERSETSEGRHSLETSEGHLKIPSEGQKALIPFIQSIQEKNLRLTQQTERWKVTAVSTATICLISATFFVVGMKGMKDDLSEGKQRLSEVSNALNEMSERAFSLAEREINAIKTISEREKYIQTLEGNIPADRLKEIKGGSL